MAITPIKGDLKAGVAGQWSETFDAGEVSLLAGDVPALATMQLPAAAAQTFEAHEVVGFDGSNRLIPAVHGVTAAIGFVMYAPSAATTAGQLLEVVRMGCFNPDRLVWDASYDTDEKKRLAFEGAPSPTQIILRKPRAMTV